MTITILTDNKNSWYIKYGAILKTSLSQLGYNTTFINDKESIRKGDVCFLLSCTKILPETFLKLNKYNIVVHASDLPEGKGFSPMQWQILEGRECITLTLFNAVKELDAGDYFLKEKLCFDGHELLDELHKKMGEKINEMCLKFIKYIKELEPVKQTGQSTFYPKRTSQDDRVDPNKTILELFNHFRIANNIDYPLYFEYKGFKYNIKIEKRSRS